MSQGNINQIHEKIVDSDRALIDVCLSQATGWKNVNKQSMNQFIKDPSTCVAMEKLTYITKGKLAVSENIWGDFMECLKQNVSNDQ